MEELIVFLHVMKKTKIYHLEQHRKKPKNKSNKICYKINLQTVRKIAEKIKIKDSTMFMD